MWPTVTLFALSFIYINLLLLLEYEHRQFHKTEVDITETNSLFQPYLCLFAAGIFLTGLHSLELIPSNQYIIKYVLLAENYYYSFLYYALNLLLGNTYIYLYKKAYIRANKERLPVELAASEWEACPICLREIGEGQKIAKITCMHVFHSHCLHRWIKKRMNCPVCLSGIP